MFISTGKDKATDYWNFTLNISEWNRRKMGIFLDANWERERRKKEKPNTFMYLYNYIYIYIYVCMYVCMYLKGKKK